MSETELQKELIKYAAEIAEYGVPDLILARFERAAIKRHHEMRQAQRDATMQLEGTRPGRKRKEIDLAQYQELQRQGKSRRHAAAQLGVSPATLFRRVKEAQQEDTP